LNDPDHRADVVENVRVRVIHVFPLGNGEEAPVALQGFLHGLYGPGSTGGYGYRYAGIDDRIPEGKNRE
jgi:hypothetical protein